LLLKKAKAPEVVLSPAGLVFNHASQGLGWECVAWPMKRNRHATAVSVAVVLVGSLLSTEEESITHQRAHQLTGSERAQCGPVNAHTVTETSGSGETRISFGIGSPSLRSSCTIISTTSWMCLSASSSVFPHVAAPCLSSAGQYADHLSSSGSTT